MALISRDPFARHELHREKAPKDADCDWCCNKAKWHYYYEEDSLRYNRGDVKGNFCSIGCMRCYHY